MCLLNSFARNIDFSFDIEFSLVCSSFLRRFTRYTYCISRTKEPRQQPLLQINLCVPHLPSETYLLDIGTNKSCLCKTKVRFVCQQSVWRRDERGKLQTRRVTRLPNDVWPYYVSSDGSSPDSADF